MKIETDTMTIVEDDSVDEDTVYIYEIHNVTHNDPSHAITNYTNSLLYSLRNHL